MSTTRDRLSDAIKVAMRAGDKFRLTVLRMVMAEIKQREIDSRTVPDEATVTAILAKMVKQRRESISQYTAADRSDLATREQAEIDILQDYMPQSLSAAEIESLIDEAIAQTNATSIRQMGAVMAILKEKTVGAADLSEVSALVKARLS